MPLMTALARWRKRLRDHRAELAERVAHLERVAAGKGDDNDWEKIFARAEWRSQPFTHQGKCVYCGSKVDFHARRCGECGAEWVEYGDDRNGHRTILFALVSLTVALIGGVGCRYGVGMLLRQPDRNPEFVEFVQSYLWVAGTILILVAATYVYERMNIAPKGHWERAKRLDKSGALRHS
jgi:predicted nucleic acid-binding Zn ribbon protein